MTLSDFDQTQCVTKTHGSDIAALARKALGILASQKAPVPKGVANRLDFLCDTFAFGDEGLRKHTVEQILNEQISPIEVVDFIIPSISRLLGEKWSADEISFVDLTIAVSRLQETTRGLLSMQPRNVINPLGTVLLINPKGEDHSLGIHIAADQFKRHGYDVDLAVGKHALQIVEMVRENTYCLIGATAATLRTLAEIKNLVERIHGGVPRTTPIVVGGPIAQSDIDVQAIAGVDHMASDVEHILGLCNLPSKIRFDSLVETE